LNSNNVRFVQFTQEFEIDQLTLVKALVGNSKVFLILGVSGEYADRPELFNYIAERGLETLLLYASYCCYANTLHYKNSAAGLTLSECIREGIDPTLYLLSQGECGR